ncbi:hypothetical protein A6U96_07550 [Agrobacterium tumefaciens]|nr:hypothetical protein A6U96_07550 [Agrobacterium tumefaciens]
MPQAQPIQAARLPVTEARAPMSMRRSTGRRRRSDRDPWLGLKVLSIDMGEAEGNPCRDQRNNERIGDGSIASPQGHGRNSRVARPEEKAAAGGSA